ncbi:MAG TPA: hypothetical protein PKA03_12940 [Tabrizicola sp.]|nr:hypothetical protein [Tabrizicola sp.]
MGNRIWKTIRWATFMLLKILGRLGIGFVKLVGKTRLFGMSSGFGVGAFLGASVGVASGGNAVAGTLVFGLIGAVIGLLAAWIAVLYWPPRVAIAEKGKL